MYPFFILCTVKYKPFNVGKEKKRSHRGRANSLQSLGVLLTSLLLPAGAAGEESWDLFLVCVCDRL